MDRRTFLKGLFWGTAGAFLAVPASRRILAQALHSGKYPDIAAVMGGEPDAMFDKGIDALGGMRRFVKTGDIVAVKPNASWNVVPEKGATTNPKLIGRIVEHCLEAGAKKVFVFDNTLDSWQLCFATTLIESFTKKAGGAIVPASSKGYYQKASVPGAEILKDVLVHELVLEADVFINVPVLKHHGSTTITAAMKNLMGVVWDRGFYHWKGLDTCIAEFPLLRKPDLNIIDAYTVMLSGGPRGTSYKADLSLKKMQILSTDIVAADAAAAKTWGTEPEKIRYITHAAKLGFGNKDLDSLSIARIRL